jgi:streptogramin lyase
MRRLVIASVMAAIAVADAMIFASMKFYAGQHMPIEKTEFSSLYRGCGAAHSNKCIKEYLMPTECSQPLGILVDEDGFVWFRESSARNSLYRIPQLG